MFPARAFVLMVAFAAFFGMVDAVSAQPAPSSEFVLKPAGPWNLHGDKDSCKLRRGFGDGDQHVGIELVRYGPGDDMRVFLFGRPIAPLIDDPRYTIAFGDFPPLQANTALSAKDGAGIPVTIRWIGGIREVDYRKLAEEKSKGLPITQAITPTEEAAVRSIALSSGKLGKIVLQTGSMGPALQLLRQCTDELVRTWGADPKLELASRPKPRSPVQNWVDPNTIPQAAAVGNSGSMIYFRLSVDADGKVSQCGIQQVINESAFDKAICAVLMKRAKFDPARDKAGKAVPSYFRSSIRLMGG